MTFCFDIDGTICSVNEGNDYNKSQPYPEAVREVNRLFDEGHKVIFFTARGASSGKDCKDFTDSQLKSWGVKYHELITGKKPSFDVLIDDKAINALDWMEEIKTLPKIGLVASSFDLLHAGHMLMLKDARSKCTHLIAALQTDPTTDRPEKNRPIQSLEERRTVLEGNRYIDEILIYDTEEDLKSLLIKIKPDIRILGTDWRDKNYTGKGIAKEEYFHERNHNWSTTNLRKRIKEQI